MLVNEITEKIEALDFLLYKCVFFNGLWGIGKSYAADQVKDKEKIVRVSLSGLKSSDEIYAEILDAYVGKNGFSKVIGKVAGTAVRVATNFDQTRIASEVISDITGTFLSAKAALRIYFNRQQKLRIVVLDDFERVWDDIDITEVFRVVEFLINQKNVKVSMIGDLSKLSESISEKFKRYSERYIDRIYNITEMASNIDWSAEPLCIDEDFITQFRMLHNCHNIRSIIKANNFYNDIRIMLLKNSDSIKFDSERFWDDIRLVAFAIIIESLDGLKLSELQLQDNADGEQRISYEIAKQFENRVRKYLSGSRFGIVLIKPVNEYYETNSLKIKMFEEVYSQSLEDDELPYFYSDEATIRKELPKIRTKIGILDDMVELVKTMRDYASLCGICGEKIDDAMPEFRERLHGIVISLISQDITDFLEEGYCGFILENNNDLLSIVNEELGEAKAWMINYWIDELLHNEYTEREFDLAKRLADYSELKRYKGLVEIRYADLLSPKIFPIEAHNEIQYYTCMVIMRMLYDLDSNRIQEYYQELKLSIKDSVALHRCSCAMESLQKA